MMLNKFERQKAILTKRPIRLLSRFMDSLRAALKSSFFTIILFSLLGCSQHRADQAYVGVPGGDTSSVDSLVQGLRYIREHPAEREDERVQRFLWLDQWIQSLDESNRLTPEMGREFFLDFNSFVKDPSLGRASLETIVSRAETKLGRNVANYELYLNILKDQSIESALSYVRSIEDDGISDLHFRAQQLLNLQSNRALSESRRIGVLIPFKGEFQAYGRQVMNAVQVASNLAYSDGVEFLFRDAGETEDELLESFQKLVLEDKVAGIIGPISSAASEFVFERAQIMGVPVVSLAPRENLEMYGPYSFRSTLSLEDQIEALAKLIREKMRAKRVGILYPDSRYGWDASKIAERVFDERGVQIRQFQIYPEGATDFKNELKRMTRLDYPKLRVAELCPKRDQSADEEADRPANPNCVESLNDLPPILDFEVLLVPDFADTVGLMLPTLPFLKIYGLQVVGLSGLNSMKLVERGQQHAEGVIFTDSFDVDSASVQNRLFLEKYEELAQEKPSKLAAEAFDVSMIFVSLMRKASGATTRDQIFSGLRNLYNFPGVTGEIYADQGQLRKRARLFIVRDGKIKSFQ
ncbi:MAG: hypothetical protein COT73_05050 [Bdellovibrio sp. CG10_big_fil_rev_8_21_14_0_10_47_8]|nr:MAG: hypothetical protein COT73_05050 [Bdellovibrio sp. CG10_big_fil_rev_8_21_14_0_10_47_8]